ncbi:MAG: hypothetical protein ABI581_07960 [Sediminibacterium sp.]
MEKIKNTKQLNAARKQLKQKQYELEKAIHYNWRDVKDSLTPVNLAKQMFAKIFEKKVNEDTDKHGFGNITKVASAFANRMGNGIKEKFEKWIKH